MLGKILPYVVVGAVQMAIIALRRALHVQVPMVGNL